MSSFMGTVTHMIHSITLEDIRYFFDPRVPVDNNIPTCNTNLTDEKLVLDYAPSKPSIFKFPGGALFDRVMKQDNPENFDIAGTTRLEEIAHGFHMMEMWNRASSMYKTIVQKEIDVDKVCPCLIEVEQDDIVLLLTEAASNLRTYTTLPKEGRIRRAPKRFLYPNTPRPEAEAEELQDERIIIIHQESSRDRRETELESEVFSKVLTETKTEQQKEEIIETETEQESEEIIETETEQEKEEIKETETEQVKEDIIETETEQEEEEMIILPELKDHKSWEWWKMHILMENPMEDQGIYNFAMYMFCKIQGLVGDAYMS